MTTLRTPRPPLLVALAAAAGIALAPPCRADGGAPAKPQPKPDPGGIERCAEVTGGVRMGPTAIPTSSCS
jgi:hypothetical protein